MENKSNPLGDRSRSNSSSSSFRRQTSKVNAVEDINLARRSSTQASDPQPPMTELERKRMVLKRAMSVTNPPKKACNRNILTTISSTIIQSLERAFFGVGRFVGTYPIMTIVLSLVICGICGLLVESFVPGNDEEDWVPSNSRLLDEKDWVENTYANEIRFVTFLIEDSNVLTPVVLQAMQEYYERSFTFSANGKRFGELCLRSGSHCSVVSILELWEYNSTVINALQEADIIDKLNTTDRTPRSNRDVTTLLGGVISKTNGAITGAQATQMTWETTKVDEAADEAFEGLMIDYGLEGHTNIAKTYVYSSRSQEDEANAALDDDTTRLAFGFLIVFVYIMFTLGRFNLVEQKVYLAISGIFCVILSIVVAYGIGSGFGVRNSALQTLMPFLLLGIGVDDMFVISEAWRNLSPEDDELAVPDKISVCLAHAGMSITVTSVTDVVAFGIGASTVIPALGSFCIFATIGIFALFCLVSTFFVAVLTLDEKRRRARRDACIVCFKHSENYHPNKWSTGRSFLQRVFTDYYGPLILKTPVKVIIIILSLTMVSLGMWRFTSIEEDFDPINYIPSNSYAHDYLRTREDLFDTQGISTRVYCASFDYSAQKSNLDSMHAEMLNSSYIQRGTVTSWFTDFHAYAANNGHDISTAVKYNHELFTYLTGEGLSYNSFVLFNSTAEPVEILGSFISATHSRGDNAKANIDAMDGLREIIDTSGFPKFSGSGLPEYKCFAYDPDYQALETNKVLGEELMRNLILAGITVLVMTIILVADLKASFMVFICVLFTVVDVGGVLELWGTTIDTASSVLLTLAVGLAVDYSAHVGHTFMTVEGTRGERALLTLKHIGPAVFNGGLSTLLAFILLADSASYGFALFFRVFLAVVLFGMFHGLCLLPVILSLLGPPSYQESRQKAALDVFSGANKSNNYHQNGKTGENLGNKEEVPQPGNEGSYSELPKDNVDHSRPESREKEVV